MMINTPPENFRCNARVGGREETAGTFVGMSTEAIPKEGVTRSSRYARRMEGVRYVGCWKWTVGSRGWHIDWKVGRWHASSMGRYSSAPRFRT